MSRARTCCRCGAVRPLLWRIRDRVRDMLDRIVDWYDARRGITHERTYRMFCSREHALLGARKAVPR